MRELISSLGPQKARYLLALLFAVLLGVAEAVLHPLLVKAIFDSILVSEDLSLVILLGVLYLALGLSINVSNFFLSLWNARIENRIVAHVSAGLLASFYKKDYLKIVENGEGYYVSRIRTDVKDGLVPALAMFRRICVGISTFIALIFVLIYLSLQAFVVLALIIPIASAISIIVSKKTREVTITERDDEATVLALLSKSVDAFRIVNFFQLRRAVASRFEESMTRVLNSGYRRFKLVTVLRGSSDLVMVVSDAASMFVGAYLVFQRQMTVGSFVAFMNAFWRAATTLMGVFNDLAEFHSHSAIISRLAAFRREDMANRFWKVGPDVRSEKLAFRYEEEPVFENLDFVLEPGKRALILGENGSGKSTFANILSGMLRPTQGSLTLPERISAVTLPLHIPPLRIADLEIDERLLKSLRLWRKDIDQLLPHQLSVGQQQKLAIALALSAEADLYIFDEPFANLDDGSRETAIGEIIERTKGKMLIMILHDAERYMSQFDQIIRLDEYGSVS